MHELVQALRYVDLAAFVALAAASVHLWLRRRGAAAFWAMTAFGVLGTVEIAGLALPDHPTGLAAEAGERILIALLLLFPYLLFRFTTAFDRPRPSTYLPLNAMTAILVVWTFAQPSFPETGERRPVSFLAYLAAFVFHWAVLSTFSALRLWRAGHGQPSVSRRRMRLLATASAMLTAALVIVGVNTGQDNALAVSVQALAFVAALAFLLGLTPPGPLRAWWREPEQRLVADAIEGLMVLARSREEVVQRVLEPMVALVGARGVAMHSPDGELLGARGVPTDAPPEGPDVLHLDVASGSLTVWTTPYAPFFGEDELRLLESLSTLTWIAIDRVRLFEEEHEARVALQRGNEVMASFVSLAAHELRTPVTSIHGFVHTLNHLGDRLTPDRRAEVSRTLEQQTARLAGLVEQLLDLSRLDAEAIEIAPRPLSVRGCVAEFVGAAVPARAGDVRVEVDEALEAELDPVAFERIVGNLVTNAFRYGAPPVVVRAEQNDRHFRLYVEDAGGGVPDEFVPDLFERFSRSDDSRALAPGTGLGLAIARSYARAHGGDLLYEPADPHGARFQFVLPTRRGS